MAHQYNYILSIDIMSATLSTAWSNYMYRHQCDHHFHLTLVIVFLAGLLVMHLRSRKKAVHSLPAEGQANVRPAVSAGPVYEEVSPKEEIEVKNNQAYGPL